MKRNNILITVDLEDWFQVENFKNSIPFSEWDAKELRFENNTRRLLEIFEECNIKATFFVLAWNAERVPELVRDIYNLGHEIASHGYNHHLCSDTTIEDLRQDLQKSKSVLEEIIGSPVLGYRAPSFSITGQAISLLKEIGYTYDSSYNNFGLNHRHGSLDLSQYRKKSFAYKDPQGFWELPISNLTIGKMTFPWGGGGYFRLLNRTLFRIGVQRILKKERGYMFYIHPWEIDPNQPLVSDAGFFFRFRHYLNLGKCESKLSSFIESFQDCSFLTCSQYLKSLDNIQKP
ncbi:MAG: DUF3473 domain-containing protein [Candidatus Scalindua rubra]|uniref:Polysaccharide deacetylase n=1 Tax=Candidatus Scalindua brodae TaxID=237368 RepID=A0A0B0EIF4_9BACT|nr:MAG: polysaccharide deacetylase [Candidatus Scalindua brodae]MBZ0108456.1 DUF3473 domain-containing protein [Candidatus Scalindua rubra]TWU28815.1 Peptidoglycan deacetylase [Candidatus Brocadiaceae bacterium S225]